MHVQSVYIVVYLIYTKRFLFKKNNTGKSKTTFLFIRNAKIFNIIYSVILFCIAFRPHSRSYLCGTFGMRQIFPFQYLT